MSPVRAARKAGSCDRGSRIEARVRSGLGGAAGRRAVSAFPSIRASCPDSGARRPASARRGHRPPARCLARRDDRLRSKEVLLGSLGSLDRPGPWRRAIGPLISVGATVSSICRAELVAIPFWGLRCASFGSWGGPQRSELRSTGSHRARAERRSVGEACFPALRPGGEDKKKARQGEGPVGPGFVRGEGPTQMGVAWRGAPARELLLRRSITPDLVRCNIPCPYDRRTVGRGSMTCLGVSPRAVRDSGCRPCRSRGPRPGSALAGPA